MHRLFVETSELESDSPALAKAAAKHLRVLRPKDGEEIELFDGAGRSRVCVFERGALSPVGGVSASPRPTPMTLFACVTKGSRWDWTVEKATELGATRIVPVISERTIVRIPMEDRAAKRERWMRVAEDAARQSDAKWLPEIMAPVDFAASLPLVRETTCFVGALVKPTPRSLLQALMQGPGNRRTADGGLAVFVGPEGDFTPDELSALCEVSTPVTFGATILRAETAAIYGLSVVKSFLLDLETYRIGASES